jgi:hypothetical protein
VFFNFGNEFFVFHRKEILAFANYCQSANANLNLASAKVTVGTCL